MARFSKRDTLDILELLEKELDSLPRLERVEKMKLRSKIRHQESWIAAFEDPKPSKVMLKLEGRLSEIFRLYSSSFKDKVRQFLDEKCFRSGERERAEQGEKQ
jgi:hypothetical protein